MRGQGKAAASTSTLGRRATAEACRKMTDADLRGIEKIHASLMRALKAKRGTEVLTLNQHFHFAIYRLARSWVLMPMIEALWLRAGPFMHLAQMSPGVMWDGRHHAELMRALRRRDARVSATRDPKRHQHGGTEPQSDAVATNGTRRQPERRGLRAES